MLFISSRIGIAVSVCLQMFINPLGVHAQTQVNAIPTLKSWQTELRTKPRALRILRAFPRIVVGFKENPNSPTPEIVKLNAASEPFPKGYTLRFLKGTDSELSLMLNADFVNSAPQNGVAQEKLNGERVLNAFRNVLGFQSVIAFPGLNSEGAESMASIEFTSVDKKHIVVPAQPPQTDWSRKQLVDWYFKSLGIDGVVLDRKGAFMLVCGNEQKLIQKQMGVVFEKNSTANEGAFFRNPSQKPMAFIDVVEANGGLAVVKVYPNDGNIRLFNGSYIKMSE
jgi:hypothetical protein